MQASVAMNATSRYRHWSTFNRPFVSVLGKSSTSICRAVSLSVSGSRPKFSRCFRVRRKYVRQRRAAQRLGRTLGRKAAAWIVGEIRAGRARFVRRRSRWQTEWRVQWGGTECYAVYCTRNKRIIAVWRAGYAG